MTNKELVEIVRQKEGLKYEKERNHFAKLFGKYLGKNVNTERWYDDDDIQKGVERNFEDFLNKYNQPKSKTNKGK